MIKILADQNIYKIADFLPKDTDLTFYDPANGIPDAHGFDAMIIRTVTKLNPTTFNVPDSLKFIGTASSGSDHVDIDQMNKSGVHFVDAKGCNARAVAEYVLTALLLLREQKGVSIDQLRYGIIGAGAVGSAVAELFDSFGLQYILHDPPRALLDPDFKSSSMEEILQCDVLTFHVPYSEAGEFQTRYWLDELKLKDHSFKVIINAARGGIINEQAVLNAYNAGRIEHLIIDVWENEPDFNPDFVHPAFIVSPHIAGYSHQAKLNASRIVMAKFCEYFGLELPNTDHLYDTKHLELAHLKYDLEDLLLRLHPIKEYDAALRDLIGRKDKKELFAKLREDRPYRYEYTSLSVDPEFMDHREDLRLLGLNQVK